MRDDMKEGDGVLFYHSNASPPGVAGIARVVREGYPDPTARDPESNYFDPKASDDDPRWFMVDIAFEEKFDGVVPLGTLKETPGLEEMVVTKRSRLSVQPVRNKEFEIVKKSRRARIRSSRERAAALHLHHLAVGQSRRFGRPARAPPPSGAGEVAEGGENADRLAEPEAGEPSALAPPTTQPHGRDGGVRPGRSHRPRAAGDAGARRDAAGTARSASPSPAPPADPPRSGRGCRAPPGCRGRSATPARRSSGRRCARASRQPRGTGRRGSRAVARRYGRGPRPAGPGWTRWSRRGARARPRGRSRPCRSGDRR
jgi:predicted RNA-binding protein with PUA-like domain